MCIIVYIQLAICSHRHRSQQGYVINQDQYLSPIGKQTWQRNITHFCMTFLLKPQCGEFSIAMFDYWRVNDLSVWSKSGAVVQSSVVYHES